MIKFFRNIRKKLLQEGKTANYLKYAVGEIILVVIGILIALQVNNWNENRKERDRETNLLDQIEKDLIQSHKTFNTAEKFFMDKTKSAAYVLRAYWEKDGIITDSLVVHMRNLFRSRREKPFTGTIESLIYSGDINIVKSGELRNELIAYLGEVNAILSDIERFDETYYRPAIKDALKLVNFPELNLQEGGDYTEYSIYPKKIQKIPFQNDYGAILSQRDLYVAFHMLSVAHRNQALKYRDLAIISNSLQKNISSYLKK